MRVSNTSRLRYLKDSFIAANVRSGRLELASTLPESTSLLDYSRALLSYSHWSAIPGDVILTFQSDSIICSGSVYNINDFAQFVISMFNCIIQIPQMLFLCSLYFSFFSRYDLIGAVWHHMKNEPGRNSGLSIRSRSTMLQLLKTFDHEIFSYLSLFGGYREDIMIGL